MSITPVGMRNENGTKISHVITVPVVIGSLSEYQDRPRSGHCTLGCPGGSGTLEAGYPGR